MVFQNISKLDSPYAFNSWIFSIAIRLYLDHKKPKKNQINDCYDEFSEVEFSTKDKDVVLQSTVQKVLKSLDEQEREAILLVDLMENTYEEAALLMKIPLLDLNQRIRSARKKFIEYCERHKIEVTGIFMISDKKVG